MRILGTFILIILLLTCSLVYADYAWFGGFDTTGNENSAGVALKSNGDLYYVTFNAGASKFMYVQNALTSPVATQISTETLPAGRGLNDVELDSSGNIYISGTGDDAATTVLKKFNAAPAHTQAWSATDTRLNGIELMNDSTLAVAMSWGNIKFKNTSDGLDNATIPIPDGTNYHRSIALNTANNDLYIGKNGNNSGACMKIMSGGTPSNLSGYSLAADDLFSPYGLNSATGTATFPIDFDTTNNRLLLADYYDVNFDPTAGIRVYSISGSGVSTIFTLVKFIDTGYNLQTIGNVYGIAYARCTINSIPSDVIAAAVGYGQPPTSYRIDFWADPPGIEDWVLY